MAAKTKASGWEPPEIDESVTEGPVDVPPSRGDDVHLEDVDLTPEEVEAGEQLGEVIDVDDNDDNGGIPLTVPPPGESVVGEVEPPDDMDPKEPTPGEPEVTP